MKESYPPVKFIKTFDKAILEKHLGFSFFKLNDYIKVKSISLKSIFEKNKLENVIIQINQENIYILETQRKNRINQYNIDVLKNEDMYKDNVFEFANAKLTYNKFDYDIKLRLKGDRIIHWGDKDTSSYKIDLKGVGRFKNLEEFSIQKPITRNYIYEYIFHKLLEINDLISLRYFFVNLFINDSDMGVYAIEEGFTSELIEKNKRRNGPIFGVDEGISSRGRGISYPLIKYDLYSEEFWLSNYPELASSAILKLNQLKDNKIEINEIFDLDKWASYFAIIDLVSGMHGIRSKSVKLYYNPVTNLFEPIGFDAHIIPNSYNNFLLLDFLDIESINCSSDCYDKNWIIKFLRKTNGEINDDFIKIYLDKLKIISSGDFLKKFEQNYKKQINFFNRQLYKDNSKKNLFSYKGIGLYIYDDNYLNDRSLFIRNRLKKTNEIGKTQHSLNNDYIVFDNLGFHFFKQLNVQCAGLPLKKFFLTNRDSLNFKYNKNCNYFIGNSKLDLYENIFVYNKNPSKIEEDHRYNILENEKIILKNTEYFLTENIDLDRNYYLPKNNNLNIQEGVTIRFLKDVVFDSEGSIFFNGTKENPIIVESLDNEGSLILRNNIYKINYVNFKNLSFPKFKENILSGGINVINSNITINNSVIRNSNSEDAINIISSESLIKNLKMENIKSDALDIDFGVLNFENISCNNTINDCLDLSGSKVEGKNLEAINVFDKGISVGENTVSEINQVFLKNCRLGVAVKDGSELTLSNVKIENNEIDIAIFKKKEMYDEPKVNLKDLINFKKFKVYSSVDDKNLISNQNIKIQKLDNSYLNSLFY